MIYSVPITVLNSVPKWPLPFIRPFCAEWKSPLTVFSVCENSYPVWSSSFSGCLFDRPNIFVLYASCCQIFSFEWMLDSFLWLPLVFQLVFQLYFYTDHQNLGNISLASLCKSKITFLISNTVLIKFFVCKWSQSIKKLSNLCVFTHPSVFLVLHVISAMYFTSRLLVKGLNDYIQAQIEVSPFEKWVLGSNSCPLRNPHCMLSLKLYNKICFTWTFCSSD